MNADLLHVYRNLSIAVVSSYDAPNIIYAVEKLILKRLGNKYLRYYDDVPKLYESG